MLIYSTEVANAINRYEVHFFRRISFARTPRNCTEEEFVNIIDNAVSTNSRIEEWEKIPKVKQPQEIQLEIEQTEKAASAEPKKKTRGRKKKNEIA